MKQNCYEAIKEPIKRSEDMCRICRQIITQRQRQRERQETELDNERALEIDRDRETA